MGSLVADEAREPEPAEKLTREGETPSGGAEEDDDWQARKLERGAGAEVGAEAEEGEASQGADADEREGATTSEEMVDDGFASSSEGPWTGSVPGPSSARDRYLRQERFPDVKESFLAFKREDD